MRGTVFEIKRFAVHDGDGIRTTVFLKGCPLRCVWCHNPEGISPLPQKAFFAHKCIGCGECGSDGFSEADCLGEARLCYGRDMTVDRLLPLLTEDKEFFLNSGGGVTLSGGECLMQADFCRELLAELKSQGISTAVDTCGYAPREALDKVIPYTDVFLYDLKAYDGECHKKCTGKDNRIILDNLKYLDDLGCEIEIRIPFVPGYNDGETEAIGGFVKTLRHVRRIRLLPYHNYAGSKYEALGMENLLPAELPRPEQLENAANTLRRITGIEVI